MDLHELSFGKIIILTDDIAEVIINENVEMNIAMVEKYHDFLLTHLKAPFSLLVNKINAYTYNFEAQLKIATLEEIDKMAVVSYNRVTNVATDYLAQLPRELKWNLKVFNNREQALEWLKSTDQERG